MPRWPTRTPEQLSADRKQRRRKRYAENRDLILAQNRKWWAANPEKIRESVRKWRKENPEKMRALSRRKHAKRRGYLDCTEYPPPPADSRCAICSKVSKMYFDHDHETGMFRGYLCRFCNTGLGRFGDNIDGLRRVLEYLERALMRSNVPHNGSLAVIGTVTHGS